MSGSFITHLSIIALSLVPTIGLAQENEETSTISGKLGADGKYNTNTELASGVVDPSIPIDEEIEAAPIIEISGLVRWEIASIGRTSLFRNDLHLERTGAADRQL